jgi:hypothetical protein
MQPAIRPSPRLLQTRSSLTAYSAKMCGKSIIASVAHIRQYSA